jgi:hypothetical protein
VISLNLALAGLRLGLKNRQVGEITVIICIILLKQTKVGGVSDGVIVKSKNWESV